MLPVLAHCAGRDWPMRDLIQRLADDIGLSGEERSHLLPGKSTTTIASRVHWAKTHLKQAGLIEQPSRGVARITPRGRDWLARSPHRLELTDLRAVPEYCAFTSRTRAGASAASSEEAVLPQRSETPNEQIAAAAQTLDILLREAVLARILAAPPAFFERLIIDLLLAMGYGGSGEDAGRQLGGTGDGGVDGLIQEDQLGFDRVYLQAKRYQPGNTVGSEAVQAFMGALVGKGAHKGVLITTSSFSRAAVSAAERTGQLRIILIDGNELTRLMLRFNVGVRVVETVQIKDVDLAYFGIDEQD